MSANIYVKRTINFYYLNALHNKDVDSSKYSFRDIINLFGYYKLLKSSGRINDLYVNLGVGNAYLYLGEVAYENGVIKGKIGYSRYDHPEGEIDGKIIRNLGISPSNAKIYTPTHFVIFPNKVVGIEFNLVGPRHNRLEQYMKHLAVLKYCGGKYVFCKEHFELKRLVRGSIHDVLRSLDSLRMVFIKAYTKNILSTTSDNLLFKKLFALASENRSSQYVIVGFSVGNKRDAVLEEISVPDIIELIQEVGTEAFVRISVRGYDVHGRIKEIDNILSYFIYTKKDVPLRSVTTRSVDSEAMYRVIINAYNEFKDELESIVAYE